MAAQQQGNDISMGAPVDAGPAALNGGQPEIWGRRAAEPGEVCTCGRPAVVVDITEKFGPVGWCGRGEGGDRVGPCPFCGQARHPGRCPAYTIRPNAPCDVRANV